MTAGDDGLWCGGCGEYHPASAFYRTPSGRPYGPCKRNRRAASKANRRRRSQELGELRQTIAALRSLVTTVEVRVD
jgi:hypothetical protein